MQVVRRGCDHARPGTAAHHMGGRERAPSRVRCRDADADLPLRSRCDEGCRAKLAGRFGRALGSAARPRTRRRSAAAQVRFAEGGHDECSRRVLAEERRAIQRECRRHRLFRPRSPRGSRAAPGRDDHRRRLSVSDAAVHCQHAVQEASRRTRLGSDAVFVDLVTAVTIIKHLKTSLAVSGLVVIMTAAASRSALAQVELAGSWAARNHEDALERGGGPYAVDYTGIPIDDEGRQRALSYSASQLSMIERQCSLWAQYYLVTGPFGMKISNETDPIDGSTIAWKIGGWED